MFSLILNFTLLLLEVNPNLLDFSESTCLLQHTLTVFEIEASCTLVILVYYSVGIQLGPIAVFCAAAREVVSIDSTFQRSNFMKE